VGIIGKNCHELRLKVAVILRSEGFVDEEIDIGFVFVGAEVLFNIPGLFEFASTETGDMVLCSWMGVSSPIVGTDP
jgi:hypothetical protein